jgi:hypothetical protein
MTEVNKRFVAFIDIAGYKNLVKNRPREALAVIKEFFKIGYWATHESDTDISGKIKGIFVSDCGIIWTKETVNEENSYESFKLILTAVKKINEKTMKSEIMHRNRRMLSTSIAFGEFYPIDTVAHGNIQKNLIYGQAYIDAYLDNSNKLDPGLCRIVTKKLPDTISRMLSATDTDDQWIPSLQKEGDKLYYYWNCRTIDEISAFKKQYQQAIDIKYKKMFDAISKNYLF